MKNNENEKHFPLSFHCELKNMHIVQWTGWVAVAFINLTFIQRQNRNECIQNTYKGLWY